MSAETVPPPRRFPGRGLALREGEEASSRSVRTMAGIVTLVVTAVLTIASGTTPVSIALSGISVVLLAGHPSLGPLGAAAIVMLTLPYDRAANGYLPRVATIPIRPQDLAVLLGVALTLPFIRLRRPKMSVAGWLLVAFVAIGLVAVVAGFLSANDTRDTLRDARWWFLYGSGILLVFLPATARAQVLRGVLAGALGFAAVMVATAVLPVMPDGVKARAQEFDFGLLRLQYGNSVFLLVPLAWSAFAWIRGQTWALAPLILASLAVMLSLTRTLMLVSMAIVLLVVLATLIEVYRRRDRTTSSWPFARVAAAVAVLPVTLLAALTIISANPVPTATPRPTPGAPLPGPNAPAAEDPFGRVTFDNDESGWGSIVGGRLKTYMRAVDIIVADPVGGAGMGATVLAEYQFGGEKFATPGRLPNVDNAFLTAGMKGGVPALVVLLGVIFWPLLRGLRNLGRIRRIWWLPAWLAIVALTMTQSFATTGYGPFLLGMLVVVLGRGYASTRVRRAAAQE